MMIGIVRRGSVKASGSTTLAVSFLAQNGSTLIDSSVIFHTPGLFVTRGILNARML